MFAVLRIDESDVSGPIENKLSAVACYPDEGSANEEADRLNGLRPDVGSRYIVLVSRLKG